MTHNLCLYCGFTVIGRRESYICPTCGRQTNKINKRLMNVAMHMTRQGWRIHTADTSITLVPPPHNIKIMVVYMDFNIRYDEEILREVVKPPAGYEYHTFRRETGEYFTRIIYNDEHLPLFYSSATAELKSVIRSLEKWVCDIEDTGKQAILTLLNFYNGERQRWEV